MEPQGVAAPSRNDQPLPPGTVLGGRYEIIEAIDEASFGFVYRATSRGDGRTVSIEILDPRIFADSRLRASLRKEIELLAGIEQKNLAMALDFGDEHLPSGSIAYAVLENLDGQSLFEMFEKKRSQGKAFSLKGAFNVVAHLANALAVLHERPVGGGHGWYHGGLSLRSIHISSSGRVKILELGVARALLTSSSRGAVAGAIPNVAPEERTGRLDLVDRRADVYAVGAILYELVTGEPPAEPPAPASTIVPTLPRALDVFLDRCLRTQPSDRYPDMASLKEAMQAANGEAPASPTTTMPPQVMSSAPPPPRVVGAPPPARPAPPAPSASISSRSIPALPPRAPAQPGPALPGAVPRSFNVDSALSAIDETHERWLIQKDKLDFGPFNLRDVKSQIEAGKILSDHTIVDTESGERRRVKDHPQLRELMMSTEIQHAENERMRVESSERSKHRGLVVTLLFVFVLVAAGGGAGIFWYVKSRAPKVVVVKEMVDSDLKFEISMKVDPPEKKLPGGKRVARPKGPPGSKNAFDDTTVLGDASEGGGDETLDGATVQRVMTQNFKVLVGCVKEERGRNASLHNVDMDFIIKGAGNVSAVKVNGQTTGAFASCMYGKMQTITFPKFNGSKTHASFSLALK